MTAHKPHFTLVTVHPTFVVGHDKTQTDRTKPGGMNAVLLRSLATPPPGKPMIPAAFVDVRDVSDVSLRSLELREGEGAALTEVLVNGDPTSWDEIVSFVRGRYPSVDVKLEGPFSAPFTADTSRAETQLGVKWRGIEKILTSVLDQQVNLRSRITRAGL